MTGSGSLKPAAIQFTLKRLQESTRRSGILFLLFSCIFMYRILESLKVPLMEPFGYFFYYDGSSW